MPSSLLRSMATSADWLTSLFRRPFVVASQATVRGTGGSPWTAPGALLVTAAVDGPCRAPPWAVTGDRVKPIG